MSASNERFQLTLQAFERNVLRKQRCHELKAKTCETLSKAEQRLFGRRKLLNTLMSSC